MAQENNDVYHIIDRIKDAANILDLDDWLVHKLCSVKMEWASDIEVRMDDGSLREFRAVRVWHRSPHTDKPHKGGLRYHPAVNVEMMKGHAMEMSLKCWLLGIKWGGAKGGVAVNPRELSAQELKKVTEALVEAMNERNILGPFRDVPAPDIGTNATVMNWIRQYYARLRRSREDARFAGVVTGKPIGEDLDGIPGRTEATGYGLVQVLNKILDVYGKDRNGCEVKVMGFGNVGAHFAKFAVEAGYKVIAISDEHGAIHSPSGIDVDKLWQYVYDNPNNTLRSVNGYADASGINHEEFMSLKCNVFVPAALENVIDKNNADVIGDNCEFVLEGANGPTTNRADDILERHNVIVVPDILANAGGVVVSYFEWAHNVNIRDDRVPMADKDAVLAAMSDMLHKATTQVTSRAEQLDTNLRKAAYVVSIERAKPHFEAKHLA